MWNRIDARMHISDTALVFYRSFALVFTYIALFAVVRETLVFPVGRWIWGMMLKTIPTGYITIENAAQVLANPVLLMSELILLFGYALFFFFEPVHVFVFLCAG